MEIDFQVLIYIVFVVIAILSRFLKSKKKNAAPKQPAKDESNPTPRRGTSFEDLLKQFTDKVEEKVSPILDPEEISQPKEPEPLREYDFSSNVPSDTELEEVYESSSIPSAPASTVGKKVVFEHFKGYEEEKDENLFSKELKEMLSDRDSTAKAIVLREILNRRY